MLLLLLSLLEKIRHREPHDIFVLRHGNKVIAWLELVSFEKSKLLRFQLTPHHIDTPSTICHLCVPNEVSHPHLFCDGNCCGLVMNASTA